MKVFLITSLLFFSLSSLAKELHIAVASNFLSPLKALKKEYEKDSPHKILISSGSTGKLATQIQQGAPYDIFFSADQKRITFLEKKKFILPKGRIQYARGRLAFYSGKKNFPLQKDKGLKKILQSDFEHFSIANPKLAPYGLAAKEVLQSFSLWKSLRKKIVLGNNISQAYQFVVSGAADAGLVALAQVINLPESSYRKVSQKRHSPIIQEAAVLKRSQVPGEAQKFLSFIKSPHAQKIIRNFGYDTQKGDSQ